MGLGYHRRCHNSKFIYRWQSTKYFANEAEQKSRRINPDDDKTKDIRNNASYCNKNKDILQYRSSQYSPRRYYKDYFNKEEGINV